MGCTQPKPKPRPTQPLNNQKVNEAAPAYPPE